MTPRAQAEQIVRSQNNYCLGLLDPVTPFCSCAPDGLPLCEPCAAFASTVEAALRTARRDALLEAAADCWMIGTLREGLRYEDYDKVEAWLKARAAEQGTLPQVTQPLVQDCADETQQQPRQSEAEEEGR